MDGAEVSPVPSLERQSQTIALQSCTVTWPRAHSQASVEHPDGSTPIRKFMLVDLNLNFPSGELSLICGKVGSGKSLLLLGIDFHHPVNRVFNRANNVTCHVALLGEADILTGQILSPRSPPASLAMFGRKQEDIPNEYCIVEGLCGYVPQVSHILHSPKSEQSQYGFAALRPHGFVTRQSKVGSASNKFFCHNFA
jgi:hypothetical protein